MTAGEDVSGRKGSGRLHPPEKKDFIGRRDEKNAVKKQREKKKLICRATSSHSKVTVPT